MSFHATGDGGFALVMAEADGATDETLVLRRFDFTTEAFGPPIQILGPSPDGFSDISSCTSTDGSLLLAWQSGRDLTNVFAGVVLDLIDTHFIRLVGDAPAAEGMIQANVNTVGRQESSHLVCLQDGGVALTWQSRCTAVERIGIAAVIFRPDECDSEPPEGIYLGRFGRDGIAIEAARLIEPAGFRAPTEAAMATLTDGRFVVVAGKTLRIYGPDGLLQDTQVLSRGGQSEDAELFCIGDHSCVAKSGAGAEIIDLRTPADSVGITLRANSSESLPDGNTAEISAIDPALACDDTGLCISIWELERVVAFSDFNESTSLGVFARAFDARSGRLGEEFPLGDFNGAQGVTIWPIGRNAFVVAAVMDGQTIVQRLQVR